MFCSQCGAKNDPSAKFCSKCGARLAQAPYTKSLKKQTTSGAPALWNPDAVANWSFIFTPIFGSFLNHLNWKALGEEARAKGSMTWVYISIAVFLAIVSIAGDTAARWLLIIYLLIWYLSAGRKQATFVKQQFGSDYPRKPWAKPLLFGVAGIVALLAVMVVIRLMLDTTSQ